MVYHDPFRRLVFGGSLYTSESWACGLSLAHIGTGDGGSPGTVDPDIVSAVQGFVTSGFISPHANLTWIKYNLIDVDGHYADPTTTVRWDETETPAAGTGTPAPIPQSTCVVSLMTANARGLAHTGRFYSPAFVGAIEADGRISEGIANLVAEHATTLLDAINAVDDTYRVAVVSKVGAGHQNHVTNVRVGRVIDTMRSRRTSLPEGYVSGDALA
jgi:hypothetical protein